MKKIFSLLLFFCVIVAAHAQTDSLIHIKEFSGSSVGAKLAAAMATCGTDSNIPCYLVIDASLATWPSGTLPTLCSHCYSIDYRFGSVSTDSGTLTMKDITTCNSTCIVKIGTVGSESQAVYYNSSSSSTSTESGSTSISSTSIFAFTGTSLNDDDNGTQATSIAVSSYSTTASVTTFATASAHGFSVGDWVNARFVSGWPSVPSYMAIGTGYTLFRVVSVPSTTTFTVSTSSISAGSCASSCGSVLSAMNNLPFQVTSKYGMPSTASAQTYVYLPAPVTIAGLATNFSSLFSAISPSTTGTTGYLVIDSPWNDINLCQDAATIEASYTTVFKEAHALGWTVVIPTIMSRWQGQSFGIGYCSYPVPPYFTARNVSNWLELQGKTVANAATGAYWDVFSDAGAVYNDSYMNSPYSYGASTAWVKYGSAIASAILTGAGSPTETLTWRYGGNRVQTGGMGQLSNGYQLVPDSDSYQTFQFLDSTMQNCVICIETDSNPGYAWVVFGAGMNVNGNAKIDSSGNISGTTLATTGNLSDGGQSAFAGYAMCLTTGGVVGHCTTTISSTGTCTCTQ